jgi:hypothetical protein
MKELDGRPSNNSSSPGAATSTTPLSSASADPARLSLFFRVTQPTQPSVFSSPSVQLIPNPPSSSQQPSGSNQAPPANLSLHAKVYALGEKYGIEHLKLFAIQKFEAEVESHLQSKDFLLAIEEAYTSTVEED